MGNSSGKPVVFTDDVNLNHFRLLRVVGKGAFGKVRIVERKDTGLTFALKYIRKDEIVRSESVRNILRERRMMEHLNHPFICNLRYSFQDIEYMYIVLDLMTGGDLRFHISRKTFTEEAIRFWIAELGCALHYIHRHGIIHRDVKPDNVLLDSEGHVHLADFNIACDFKPGGKLLTSKSGTLAYLAPEVYNGKGYDAGADWWSLGVLFYECIYNKRPFDGSTHTNLGKAITAANPKFPITSPHVSMPCMHAISSALEPDPNKRMGSESWQSFTNNPFFQELDFEALERKEIAPIFVPSSEKTNFDATYDLEELLLEEAPLEARARRQKPREALKDDATEKEVREDELYGMIESLFEPFDYTRAAYNKLAAQALSMDGAPTSQPLDFALPLSTSQTVPQTTQYPPSTHPHLHNVAPLRAHSSHSGHSGPILAPPDGPPPLPPVAVSNSRPLSKSRHNSRRTHQNQDPRTATSAPQPYTSTPYPTQNFSSISNPTPGSKRRISNTTRNPASGGLNVVLGATESWSDLAQKDNTLPADAKELLEVRRREGEKSGGGMLGFLNRKKGRGHSPKPMERGILSSKEGGRVVVGTG